MNYSRSKIVLVSVIYILFCVLNGQAQDKREKLSVRVDQIISNDFPHFKSYVIVKNSDGTIAQGLSPSLFNLRIDSAEFIGKHSVIPFSMRPEPIDYTILLSNSGIMDGEPLDYQKTAILQFIELMKPDDVLSVYTIGEEAVPIFEEMKKEAVDPAGITALEVSQVQPRVYDSLINILRKVERRTVSRKVIIVLSDGRDQNSRFTKDQLVGVLAETGIPVNTIGFKVLTGQSLSNLNELADLTGGTYLYSSSLKKIPEALKAIYDIQVSCYILQGKVKGLKADNLAHYLEVAVNERDAFGKGEKTFIAVKVPIPRWFKWVVLGCALLLLIVLIVLRIVFSIQKRKGMGITKRKCSECGNRLKDTWDECPFCKYQKGLRKQKKKKEKKNA